MGCRIAYASETALRNLRLTSLTAALTIVVAPAILMNASSILCSGTANRLALVVDRTRVVSGQLARPAPNGEACDVPESVGRSRGAMQPRSTVDTLTFMTLQITAQRGRFPCV
jgi:hypothetical protein